MRRSLVLGVALLAAMTLGRVLTDHVPLGSVTSKPFVRTADVGQTLRLRYTDVTVDQVRSAAFLSIGTQAYAAGGRFLVVDATVVAKGQPQTLSFVVVHGGDGRDYASTTRGACTNDTYTAPTAATYHVMYCFDVPRSALRDSRIEISLGNPGSRGGQARDDVALVDLGIGTAKAARLWATTTGYHGYPGGFDRPDPKVLTLTGSAS